LGGNVARGHEINTKRHGCCYVANGKGNDRFRRSIVEKPMASSRQARTSTATEFQTHGLTLMDEVQRSGEELIITKHGKPVARRAPVVSASTPSVFGWMRGTSAVLGDVIGPEDILASR